MIIVKHIADLKHFIANRPSHKKQIGFVPTMGALHPGHISLIDIAKSSTDWVVCSIFVNPTQFNNKDDYDQYPNSIEQDINLLEQSGCDLLFIPTVADMYPAGNEPLHYDLGFIETVLEGAYRAGHFQGVCQIVHKLLLAVTPHQLFMGQKDYQQCMVVQKMLELTGLPVVLQVCPSVREANGLAMSSRNMRLSAAEQQQALQIIKSLHFIKANLSVGSLQPITKAAQEQLEKEGFRVDYVAVADAHTLHNVTHWDGEQKIVALIAAHLQQVRLIDNISLP
jgi:pantoate--beta-alanine ligase